MFVTAALLPVLFVTPALADDDDGGLGMPMIDLDDIDLGGGSSGSAAEELNYTGALNERTTGVNEDAKVSVTHYYGDVTVYCTDDEKVTARSDYSITGTKAANVESKGKSMRIAVGGEGGWGSVKTTMNGTTSGISSWSYPLTVTVPKKALLTVTGRDGSVSVSGCEGTVKVRTTKGGVGVEGTLSKVDVASTDGDVRVNLGEDSVITSTSAIVSYKGRVDLVLPFGANNKLQVTGSQVSVGHVVDGSNSGTNVSGTIGNGGALIKVSAPKGEVDVSSP